MSQGGGFKKWGKPRSAQAAGVNDSAQGLTPKISRAARPNSVSTTVGRETPEILTLFPTKGAKFTNKEEYLLSLSSYLTRNVNVNFSAIILQQQKVDFPIIELTIEQEAEMSKTKLAQIIEQNKVNTAKKATLEEDLKRG
jgi:hypothetical protein